MKNLTAHFLIEDVTNSFTGTRKGIDNTLPLELEGNVLRAAQGMEEIRSVLGDNPVTIHSWYRCADLNAAVGGVGHSAHMEGFAVDFVCPAFGQPVDIVKAVIASNVRYDKIIQEGNWVHVSFDPQLRMQVMTAHFDSDGKATYTPGV